MADKANGYRGILECISCGCRTYGSGFVCGECDSPTGHGLCCVCADDIETGLNSLYGDRVCAMVETLQDGLNELIEASSVSTRFTGSLLDTAMYRLMDTRQFLLDQYLYGWGDNGLDDVATRLDAIDQNAIAKTNYL